MFKRIFFYFFDSSSGGFAGNDLGSMNSMDNDNDGPSPRGGDSPSPRGKSNDFGQSKDHLEMDQGSFRNEISGNDLFNMMMSQHQQSFQPFAF